MFPSAEVIGTDLSPIQPQWVPPNCKFEIDDCASEWTFEKGSFDFIHVRGLYGCIRDWPAFYREVHKCVYPSLRSTPPESPDICKTSQTRWVVRAGRVRRSMVSRRRLHSQRPRLRAMGRHL